MCASPGPPLQLTSVVGERGSKGSTLVVGVPLLALSGVSVTCEKSASCSGSGCSIYSSSSSIENP